MTTNSAKTLLALAALATLALVLVLGSCNQRNTADGSGGQRVTAAQLAATGTDDDDLDLGDNWTGSLQPAVRGGAAASSAGPRGRGQPQRQPQARPQPSAGSASNPWSIVLNTFSGETHAEAARNMVANLGNVAPELVGKTHIRTTERGSMVLFGAYPDPEDARARADLQRVKSIEVRGLPVFPRAFLTRAGAVTEKTNHPHALMSVRERHPNVDPLYTLQVAAWSDFDTGQLTPEQARRSAEAYCAELRAKGFEAYFHHEARSHTSSVTVGLFDRTGYDIQKGDLDPELTRLRRQFPAHLVNGEPLQELIDRHNPRRGTRVQEPKLVLVPRR